MSAADLNPNDFDRPRPTPDDLLLASAIAIELHERLGDNGESRKLSASIHRLVEACAAGRGKLGTPMTHNAQLMASIRVAIRRLQRLRKHEALHVRP